MKSLVSLPLLAALLAACSGGSAASTSAAGSAETMPSFAAATQGGAGSLPESGVLARVVNLYADTAGPHDLDIYGFGGDEITGGPLPVGSVAYATASDWFDPGFMQRTDGGRTTSVAINLAGDAKQLVGMSDAGAVPGTRITVIVPPPDDLGTTIRGAYDHHPDAGRGDVPQPIADKAVLVTSQEGLPDAGFGAVAFNASVGNSCLPGRFSDPEIEKILGRPAPQPIGNDLVVAPGSYTLTIHRDTSAPGEIAACDGVPEAQVPLEIGAGDRSYVFLYAAPGDSAVRVLVLPLGT